MPLRSGRWRRDIGTQLRLNHVKGLPTVLVLSGTEAEGNQLLRLVDDALGQQESCHQIKIVARCPHRDAKGFVPQPDFQRLFHGQRFLTHHPARPCDINLCSFNPLDQSSHAILQKKQYV